MYAQIFDDWAKQTKLEAILDKASKASPVYDILNSDFAKLLNNDINIQTLSDFLAKEDQNNEEDRSHRESILYFVITAITNSQCESESQQTVASWIQNIDNLASLFGFSNDHCYLFSLIYTLETEIDKNEIDLFTRLNQEIFTHIIRDKDLLPSDTQVDEKKNQLIYYLLHLLVELKNYNAAYRFYNGFIDTKVQDAQVQIDIIKTLTSECSLATSFNFLRKSGNSQIREKLNAMIMIAIQKKKINEFVHLPFNQEEVNIIKDLLANEKDIAKLFNDIRK